jgi:hypothetical protein
MQIADHPFFSYTVITDPEDPKFDLEKLVNSWAEGSS